MNFQNKEKGILKTLKKALKSISSILSSIINSILLSIVYFMGVGLTSITAKVSKKHFLDLNASENTYWKGLNLKKKAIKKYYRQF